MTAVKVSDFSGLCRAGARWLLPCLAYFGLWITQVAAGGAILEIPDGVTVPGPKVSVMDLGSLDDQSLAVIKELKRVSLGMAPQPGQERKFSRNYLASLLKQYHLQDEVDLRMGPEVTVRTEGVCITGEELRTMMEAQLPPANGTFIARRLIIPNLKKEIWLEKGDLQVVVKPLGRIPEQGTVVFGIEFFVNQVRKKAIHQSAEIRLTGLIYQAKRDIKPQEMLTAADFRVSEAEIGNRQQYYGAFPAECRAVKKIQSGETLGRNSFQRIPLVGKGRPVTVIVSLDDAEIKVTAEAGRDGWLGDEIRVVNSKSKQAFKAKVIGRNTVEVKSE